MFAPQETMESEAILSQEKLDSDPDIWLEITEPLTSSIGLETPDTPEYSEAALDLSVDCLHPLTVKILSSV